MSSGPSPKAPDDPGAFGVLRPEQTRILEGLMYRLTAQLAKTRRTADDWHTSMLQEFTGTCSAVCSPTWLGSFDKKEVTFRTHNIPSPGRIMYCLQNVCLDAKSIIGTALDIVDLEERIKLTMPRVAMLHADCVVAQPFIDGNKRWARLVLSALLVDIGFPPGTIFPSDHKEHYLAAIDKAADGMPDQLANLIIEGNIKLDAMFRSGKF